MNRKLRKKRKMQLRKMGMESYIPDYRDNMTTSIGNLPFKIAKHFVDGCIQVGKMRGYEFIRPTRKLWTAKES